MLWFLRVVQCAATGGWYPETFVVIILLGVTHLVGFREAHLVQVL